MTVNQTVFLHWAAMQLHESKYAECHFDCDFSMEIGDFKFLPKVEVS